MDYDLVYKTTQVTTLANTTQHEITRQNTSTTQHEHEAARVTIRANTTQHEYNTRQHDVTRQNTRQHE